MRFWKNRSCFEEENVIIGSILGREKLSKRHAKVLRRKYSKNKRVI